MSDVVYSSIIGVLILIILVLAFENQRLVRRKRKLSDMLRRNSVQARDHIQEALKEVSEFVAPSKVQRFRKRDRVYFLGRRFVRRVRENASLRKKAINRMAKNFLSYASGDDEASSSQESSMTGKVGPAEEFLDEESSSADLDSDRGDIPQELRDLLTSFHTFSHFDIACFQELQASVQIVHVPAGNFLFRIGERDEFVCVVQSGSMEVHIASGDTRSPTAIKRVGPGESVTSLLSFIDCLTGKPQTFRSICCRALTDSVILRLPTESFSDVFAKHPDILVRVVQLVMTRVQRVVFVALHQFLGLTGELIRKGEDASTNNNASVHGDVASSSPQKDLLDAAVTGFRRELHSDSDALLRERIEIRHVFEGEIIMKQDSNVDAALVYILDGSLLLSQGAGLAGKDEATLDVAIAGECVGQLAMLTGEANFYNCSAMEKSIVAILSRDAFFAVVCDTPDIVLSLASKTIAKLSPLVRQVDFALDWITAQGGKALFRQGDDTDATFIVLSGRLRSIKMDSDGHKRLVDEYTRGDMVGLVDVVTRTNRLATVVAVRDSELCKVPAQLMHLLQTRFEVVVSRLITRLGQRILNNWTRTRSAVVTTPGEKDVSQSTYTTVALFPSCSSVPVATFAFELVHALGAYGSVARLTSCLATERLGPNAFDSGNDVIMNTWLWQQEARHKIVIYQCDDEMTKWTTLCLRQADIIFDLLMSDRPWEVTSGEKELELVAKRVRKEVVLIHKENCDHPQNTRQWLKRRLWASNHFHIRGNARLFHRRSEQDLKHFYQSWTRDQAPNIHSDFSRLARYITGNSVGLVLGGGGARGAAHVGMLKAIEEANIPIDRVGGVSIGAFVGGLYSMSRDVTKVTRTSKAWFSLLANGVLGPLLDLTYPYLSLFTGAYFNSTLKDIFGTNLYIEDLWLPFFCCTTDLTASQERVHTRGIFWQYCRASMTYAWLLPPLCDPEDGSRLLMDGCYVNNVPADVMAKHNCKYLLAVDVAAADDRNLTNYGDTLSGWWLLWHRLNPFSCAIKVPDQSEIQVRLAFCPHYKNLEELKSNPNYEYIQPPIEKYSSASFKSFEEIREVGFHHGSTLFSGLRKSAAHGKTSTSFIRPPEGKDSGSSRPPWFPIAGAQGWQGSNHKDDRTRRASVTYRYTDLAQIVSSGNISYVSGQGTVSATSSIPSSCGSSVTGRKRTHGRRPDRSRIRPYVSYGERESTSEEEDSIDTGIAM